MRHRAKRSAFTLVELLVVISIIGMLMALLFPAVQAARETGRQNTCRNNMRNLTLATIQFEKARNQYPGMVNELHPNNTANFSRRSWVFMILPQLERMDLYEPYLTTGQSQPTQELDIVKCPTNPSSGVNTFPGANFVVNTGLPDFTITTGGGTVPADWNANGVFHDLREFLTLSDMTATPPNRVPVTRMTEAFVSTGDGTTNTIMMTENADAASWVLIGSTDHGNYTSDPLYERQVGCTWNDGVTSGSPAYASPANPATTNWYISTNVGGDPAFANVDFTRPAAYHPNIVNVSFCDGHVRSISQQIDYLVYSLLMTPRGRQSRINDGTGDPQHALFRTTVLDEKSIQ